MVDTMSILIKKSSKKAHRGNFHQKGNKLKKGNKRGYLKKTELIDPNSSDNSDSENAEYSGTDENDAEDSKKWYEEAPLDVSPQELLDSTVIAQLRQEASHIFEEEITTHSGKLPSTIDKTDFNWIKTVIARGTLSDKIAAYVLLIQDNPVVNIGFLRNMVSMVKVGKKRECFMTMDTLVDLFLENLLPPNRKLRHFAQQPHRLANQEVGEKRRRLLMLWYLEDQLKAIYSSFLQALNNAAHDSVDANKDKVITAMYKLLKTHPEQEAVLLSQIVNKLGDPSHKIGSKVIYTLTQLLDAHPAMQGVVMDELERFIFRANMGRRAQYYSVCFLSQFTYDSNSSPLATKAISIFFSLFKACIKTGEIDSRMMNALLTGVSRAYPFSEKDSVSLTEHVNTVYKVVHMSNANVAIHALCLLNLVVGETLTDRFMTAFYKKVGEPQLLRASHHAMFLNLIFMVLKRDTELVRVAAFIKRMLQVALHLSAPLICGVLVVISHIIHIKKNLKLCLQSEPSPLHNIPNDDDDDGRECYKDAEIKLDPDTSEAATSTVEIKDEKKDKGWDHAVLKRTTGDSSFGKTYNPYQRNPLYSGADKTTFPELCLLARHFHPSVSLFATNILQGTKIDYSGDPLQDFTLIRFLEKFVFKNPKQPKSSDEQISTFAVFSRRKYYSMMGLKKLRVNTSDYLNVDEKKIPVDEKFMYKYLKEKEEQPAGKKDKKKMKEEEDGESETESLADEEFDALMRGVGGLPNDHEDVDFISAIGQIPTGRGKKKGEDDDDDDDIKGSGDDEESDVEEEMGGESDQAEDFDGDELDDWGDGEEMLSDEDVDDDQPFIDQQPKGKSQKSVKKKKINSGNLFAAAEEFAELLEEDDFQAGSSSAVKNIDKAGVKQLKWESNRDKWIKGDNFKKSKQLKHRKDKRPLNRNSNAARDGGNKRRPHLKTGGTGKKRKV